MAGFIISAKLTERDAREAIEDLTQWFRAHPLRRICRTDLGWTVRRGHIADDVQKHMRPTPGAGPEYSSGCTEPEFPPWWERFGRVLAVDVRMNSEMLALAAFCAGKARQEMNLKFLKFFNYDRKYETVRVDQIETVVEPGPGVHDFGAVVLLGGRRIAFGQPGEAERMLKALNAGVLP